MQALEEIRLNMAELTKENVDLIVLANMQQNRVTTSQTKQTATINFLNIRTPKLFIVITLKFELCGSSIE